MTVEDAERSLEREVVDWISGYQLVRGRGGEKGVLYQTRSKNILRVTCKRKVNLYRFCAEILLYWVGDAVEHRPLNNQFRSMRKGAPARELARGPSARSIIGD